MIIIKSGIGSEPIFILMTNRLKTYLAACLLGCSSMFGQAISLPVVEMLGGQYYCYEVESGDSAYGIAKKFGWDYDEFCRLNPQVVKNLKKGATVYYPTGRASSADKAGNGNNDKPSVISHVVRKGDTVYGLAAKYNVTIESVYRDNPKAKDGIREGETLTFRIDRLAPEIALGNEAVPSDAKVSEKESEIVQAKPVKNLPEIRVVDEPQSPLEEDKTPEEESVVNSQSERESDFPQQAISEERVSNIVVLLDAPAVSRDREFMRGFLISLKEMQASGQKVKLTAIDASKGESATIAEIEKIAPHILVLTYEKDIPEWIVNYGNSNNLSIVNTFDVKYEGTETNPSIVQVLTPSKDFNRLIGESVRKNMNDYKLVFVDAPAASDGIASEIKSLWAEEEVLELPSATLETRALRNNNKYLFYVNATKKEEVQEILQKIETLKETGPEADVKVIGRPSWVTLVSALSDAFSLADVYIPSRFYVDWNDERTRNFVSKYEEMFNREPVHSFPVYALSGYDIAQCFVPSIAANGGDLSKGMLRGDTIQSDFILKRDNEDGGYMNAGVYLIRFTPFNTVEKIIAE